MIQIMTLSIGTMNMLLAAVTLSVECLKAKPAVISSSIPSFNVTACFFQLLQVSKLVDGFLLSFSHMLALKFVKLLLYID